MGKQSKKKKSKQDKQAHKAKVQERRERIFEGTQNNNNNYGDDEYEECNDGSTLNKWTILKGDRVWFEDSRSDLNDHNTRRGLVKEVEVDSDGKVLHYSVQPLSDYFKNGSESGSFWTIKPGYIFRDLHNWTTRFGIGQKIICNTSDGWIPGVVTHLFPVWEMESGTQHVPIYKMTIYPSQAGLRGVHDEVAAPEDSDDYVRMYPTNFRFSLGDKVLVNSQYIYASPSNLPAAMKQYYAATELWLPATISNVDVIGLPDLYAVYECQMSFKGGKSLDFFVEFDTDEHICLATSNPRERLLDAIKQDCGYEHIDDLVKEFNIDISLIQDLVLSTAIEYGNFAAMLLLEEKQELNLANIQYPNGNYLFHELAQSPQCLKLLKGMAKISFQREYFRFSLMELERGTKCPPFHQTNASDETWLDLVFKRRDLGLVDCLSSPLDGLLWALGLNIELEHVLRWTQTLKVEASESMLAMEEFTANKIIMQQVVDLSFGSSCCEEAKLMQPHMRGFLNEVAAKQLVRFVNEWKNQPRCERAIEHIIATTTKNGLHQIFRALVEADQRVLDLSCFVNLGATRDDFVQFEVHGISDRDTYDHIDVMSSIVCCNRYYPSLLKEVDIFDYIHNVLFNWARRRSVEVNFNLMVASDEHLKREKSYRRRQEILKYVVQCFQDCEALGGKLQMLNYLIIQKGIRAPSPLLPIREKNCGVLRWLVEKNFLNLQEPATNMNDPDSRKLQCLGGQRVSKALTTGTLLCFACVEFDSLFALSWLVKDASSPIDQVVNGFNILHACAYFGRLEILLWLSTTPVWSKLLAMAPATRKGYVDYSVFHVAISRGHTNVVALLEILGCTMTTSPKLKCPSVESVAAKSPYQHVREWGEKVSCNSKLERDCEKLLQMLSRQEGSSILQRHIENSGCLKYTVWEEADIDNKDQRLPIGHSYHDVLSACLRHPDADFVLSLCHNVVRDFADSPVHCDIFYSRCLEFWGTVPFELNHNEWDLSRVREFALENNDDRLCKWLELPFVNSLTIFDPNQNPIAKDMMLDDVLCQRLLDEEVILWTCLELLMKLTDKANRCIQSGCAPELETLSNICRDVASRSVEICRSRFNLNDHFPSSAVVMADKTQSIDMSAEFFCDKQYENHAVTKHFPLSHSNMGFIPVYRVVAIENYTELLQWLLQHGSGWSLEMKAEMIQLAGFMGYADFVDILLKSELSLTSQEELCKSCALGAAEAGREKVFMGMIQRMGNKTPNQIFLPFSPSKKEISDASAKKYGENNGSLTRYLPTCVVYGYLSSSPNQDEVKHDAESLKVFQNMLCFLVEKCDNSPLSLFQATLSVLEKCYDRSLWLKFPMLLSFIHDKFGLNPFCATSKVFIGEINRRVLEHTIGYDKKEALEKETNVAKDWLSLLVKWGVNIQQVKLERISRHEKETIDPLEPFLLDLQKEQHKQWATFDIVKNNCSLEMVQEAVKSGNLLLSATDRAGLHLVHVAAAYNRTDVLSWLIEIEGGSLETMDLENRTVLEVAKAADAHIVVSWIEERQARERLSRFFCTRVRRRLAQNRWLRYVLSVTKLQAQYRGKQVRGVLRSVVLMRLQGSRRFATLWEKPLLMMPLEGDVKMASWVSLRSGHENRFFEVDDTDLNELEETGKLLTEATLLALQTEECHQNATESNTEGTMELPDSVMSRAESEQGSKPVAIHMSSDVVRWLKQSDSKFRHFFVRRMEQLQQGQRSRILAKRLKGSSSTIYETYLEQKSGQRILWQEEGSTIFVWYVAKHKSVSRLMRLIDDCESRSARQRISVDSLQNDDGCDADESTNRAVRLNPLGNVPMKVYSMQYDDLHQILDASWTPKLYLSPEERGIVESRGTVLLLGRSGTGKTVCICNRMELDRHRHQLRRPEGGPGLKQLFVARSQKLRRFVAESVGETPDSSFSVFSQLVQSLEFALPEAIGQLFAHSLKMDYVRFKSEVYNGSQHASVAVDPLVVWTNIRTFLKGSIEAFSRNDPSRVLDKAQFMTLGKKRCRLSPGEREAVYDIFVKYQKVMEAKGLWDDCDRMTALLQRVHSAIQSNHPVTERIHRDKIYVDEVQDYTQVEILLFFLLSGPGDLFLAGDPAQSVVEGVEFRFEEIRSVGYFVAGQQRDLIPDKPKTVSVNFRSHSGVLDTAAAVLRRMFEVFPDSAKQLGEDRGMFTGPRPGVFHKVPVPSLKALVSDKLNGAVVLTHDESVTYWKQMLGYELVYGIRAAKGLEFKSVIVLDFFADLPKEVQKPWRDLLLGRECHVPELEGQLKLLYTGVTRCIERLFFAETTRSVAGDAFVRWSTTSSIRPTSLATKQNVDDVEAMAMTQDEWTASGLNNAEMAELHAENHEWTEALSMLEKARFCFEQGKNSEYARKVRVYRQSLLFRQGLEEEGDLRELATTNVTELEVRGAQWMERLLEENLLLEGRHFIESICPHVDPYTREQLEKTFLASDRLITVEA